MATFYETLNLPTDADETSIKKAYRKLSMEWHPDKNSHRLAEAEQRFKEIAAAQETLTDRVRKRAYDMFLAQGHEIALAEADKAHEAAAEVQNAREEAAARIAEEAPPSDPLMDDSRGDLSDDLFGAFPTPAAETFFGNSSYGAFFQRTLPPLVILITPMGIFLLVGQAAKMASSTAAPTPLPESELDTAVDDSHPFKPQPTTPSPTEATSFNPQPTPASTEFAKKEPNATVDLHLTPTQPLENIHAALTMWLSATGRHQQGFSCRLVEEKGQFTSLMMEFPPHSAQQDQQQVIDFLKQSQLVQEKTQTTDYAINSDASPAEKQEQEEADTVWQAPSFSQ